MERKTISLMDLIDAGAAILFFGGLIFFAYQR
jgi:hypothetical protein